MAWLQSLDAALFRFVNLSLSNPLFDIVMPLFSGNSLFFPLLAVLALGLAWKGGVRGRIFLLLLVLILVLGDNLVINQLKQAIGRPRPFQVMEEVRLLAGRGRAESMPSGHASLWFAATLIAFVYYRRSWRFLLPMACAVAFSRVYVGVHYPSDVLAGAVLGAGYAAAGFWGFNVLWEKTGPKWFPEWWGRLPSLLDPGKGPPQPPP